MHSVNAEIKAEYDTIWQQFWEANNHEDLINARVTDRKLFYDTVLKYSRLFEKPMVMEVGSGTGIDINLMQQRNKNIQSYASDISIKSIDVGRKITEALGGRINFLVTDTLDLAFKDRQFDIIYSQGLIEHFSNPLEVIKEQLRVLRDGGYLIINVPQKFTGYTIMKKLKMLAGKWHLGWEIEFSYPDLKKLGSLLDLTKREAFGYQYWRSWQEPAFVLRDCYDKIHRRNPLRSLWLFRNLKVLFDAMWTRLEGAWGHYFLKNIVIVFQKAPG